MTPGLFRCRPRSRERAGEAAQDLFAASCQHQGRESVEEKAGIRLTFEGTSQKRSTCSTASSSPWAAAEFEILGSTPRKYGRRKGFCRDGRPRQRRNDDLCHRRRRRRADARTQGFARGAFRREAIAGHKTVFDRRPFRPWCSRSGDRVCGLTEAQAKADGIEVDVATFPWAPSQAITVDRPDG